MGMDLSRFTLEDLHRASGELRSLAATAPSSRAVAERVVSYLFRELRDSFDGAPACPLVRLFRVVPCSSVAAELDELAIGDADREAVRSGQAQKCLVLEASRGIRPEWNDPTKSASHRIIVLSSVDALLRLPMVSALLSQLEVPVSVVFGPPVPTPDVERLCNVFHVENAPDNPLVPDQDSFVRPFGVRSVLGFGGLLPAGEAFATLLFSSVPISRETAGLFRMLAPSVRSALVAGQGAPTTVRIVIISNTYDLVDRTLRRGGIEPVSRLVRSPAELVDALEHRWDMVLAESIAGLGVRSAMTLVQKHAPGTPFIVVATPASEGAALELMKEGAHDYVTTDRLAKLTPMITRELAAADARARSERASRRLVVALSIADVLARHDSLRSATTDLLRSIGGGLGWEIANFWSVDIATLTCGASWQLEPRRFPDFERLTFDLVLPKGRGLPGRVWASGEPAWVTDLSNDANSPRAAVAAREGVHSGFAFPVKSNGEVLGVFECLGGAVRPPDGELLATMATIGAQIGDFVRRTQALSRLQTSEARGAAIITSALDGIITIDAEGRVLDVNQAAEEMFGYGRQEAIGNEMAALIIPERLRDSHRRGIARFLASGVAPIVGKRVEMPGLRKDGSEFFAELTVMRVPTSGPAVFTGFVRDITERKRAEEVMESRRLLEEAQAAAHVGSWGSAFDERDRMHWSAETYRIFGLAESETVTFETFLALVHPDDRSAVRQARQTSVLRGEPFDVVHRTIRPDGVVRVVHERATWAPGETGRRMLGTVQDITERRRVEERDSMLTAASVEMTGVVEYPQILEIVARSAIPLLADGCVVSVAEDRMSRGPRFVSHAIADLEPRARQLLAEDAVHLPVLLEMLRSGRPRVFPPLDAEDASEPLPPVFQFELGANSFISVPLRARQRIIGAITLVRISNQSHYDELDLATAQDFACRAGLSIETARLYHHAQEAARVRGEFVSIAAHELKTPITPLKMQTQSLLRELGPIADRIDVKNLSERLAMIERATGRLESLVDSLLDVSELTVGEFTPVLTSVDLSVLAHEVADRSVRDLEAAGCSLTLVAPAPVVGEWDRARMARVVSNMISNAAKYGSGHGIEMTVRKHHSSARLSVRDHGMGIPRSEQARLFELFERGVPVQQYGGFGLGLWIAKQVIEAHGGHIFLWSRPHEGSEFTIELPLRPSAVRRGAAEVPSSERRPWI